MPKKDNNKTDMSELVEAVNALTQVVQNLSGSVTTIETIMNDSDGVLAMVSQGLVEIKTSVNELKEQVSGNVRIDTLEAVLETKSGLNFFYDWCRETFETLKGEISACRPVAWK